jgi:phosphoribosylpyrophosphate synthetase
LVRIQPPLPFSSQPKAIIMPNLVLFTGNANPELARKVATHLHVPLGDALVGRFSDGEIQSRSMTTCAARMFSSCSPPASQPMTT